MPRLLPCVPIAVLVVISSCTRLTFDVASESEKLLKRDAEWSEAAYAGKDIEKILSYWSEDAVVIPPELPVSEGKEAIRNFVNASLEVPGFKIRWESNEVSFSPDGKFAYMRSTNETTVTDPNGAPMTIAGRAITIWRRDPDGEWRCVVDIWNDPPADSTATKQK